MTRARMMVHVLVDIRWVSVSFWCYLLCCRPIVVVSVAVVPVAVM